VSSLLPEGCTHLSDAPHTLHAAILDGLRVLNWQSNLSGDEMPDRKIWNNADKLIEHFEWVDKQREARISGKATVEVDDDFEPEENAVELIKRGR
jgi:hypothetical protein